MDAKFYVPYETARLLREKGYPQGTDTWYAETGKGVRTFRKKTNRCYEYIARPTYHEVLDWLFVNRLFVYSRNYGDGEYFSVVYDMRRDSEHFPYGSWRNREEALNAAILVALKLCV